MSIPRPVIVRAALLATLLACAPLVGQAKDKDKEARPTHRFAVVGNDARADSDARLKQALADSSEKSVSFVVLTGIKGENESCGDKLYLQRRDLFEHAKRPVIVSLSGSDWTGCRNSAKRTNAIERLNRLRELLYGEPESLGATKIHLTQLSASPRFRSYAENAHWKVDKVLYATINLPAANNHFLPAAGRNSEYEDRAVANRFWLNRLFSLARTDKVDAIVLFSEGDAKASLEPTGLRALLRRDPQGRDGFMETRRQILTLSQKFKGKVLLIDSAPHAKATPAIEWHDNLGHLNVNHGAIEVAVRPGNKQLFMLQDPAN